MSNKPVVVLNQKEFEKYLRYKLIVEYISAKVKKEEIYIKKDDIVDILNFAPTDDIEVIGGDEYDDGYQN